MQQRTKDCKVKVLQVPHLSHLMPTLCPPRYLAISEKMTVKAQVVRHPYLHHYLLRRPALSILLNLTLDISVSYIERGNFDYPDENPDNDSEDYDSDYIGDEPVIGCIRDGAKRKGLERKGEREEVLGMEQEEEEEEGTEKREMPTTKSGLDVKVEAQQAEDLEFILISSSRLAELARMAASQCSRCGAPLTTSVTPGNIVWKCPSGHKKVWSTRETLKRPHVGDIKLASSSWKRREPKYHHDVVIKLRPELEVVHKLTDNG
ncbi:uncharacterized protein [Diadema antillarum]|uniref:uncharacterized protein isoform X2 n=1 Tax=Diadema antillarum TaxID=105358 RepID=UPI003A874D2C